MFINNTTLTLTDCPACLRVVVTNQVKTGRLALALATNADHALQFLQANS